MALITRISRLLTADLHAVLDRLEEPEILLKQAIRDMQSSVAAAEREVDDLKRRKAQTAFAQDQTRSRLEAAEAELDLCLDAGNDDLARAVIQRKLELARVLTDLEKASSALTTTIEERTRVLVRHQQELEALSSRAAAFESSERERVDRTPFARVSPEEIDVELLKAKQRRGRS